MKDEEHNKQWLRMGDNLWSTWDQGYKWLNELKRRLTSVCKSLRCRLGVYRVRINISQQSRVSVKLQMCVSVIFSADDLPASSEVWSFHQTAGRSPQCSCATMDLVHLRCFNPKNFIKTFLKSNMLNISRNLQTIKWMNSKDLY